MELQGLYELHDRLEAAAVAGVNLVQEDFRLKRAIEQTAPLAAASPVIKKLYNMALAVVAPDCPDRAGCLLDALALSDALLCTQAGTLSGAEAEEIDLAEREVTPCRPYSVVQSMEEALTQTGSGRYARVEEAMREQPQIFQDYRLETALVTALSDRYADMAAAAERYLSSQGAGFLKLMKDGFWEETESGRCHRLRVVEAIAGGRENDFYIEVLKQAKKELRQEAIHALRFEEANQDLLFDLLKTEKGECLAVTKRVLADFTSEETDRYWTGQLKNDQKEALGYLRFSASDLVSDRIAVILNEFLDSHGDFNAKEAKEEEALLERLLAAMMGKGSDGALELYRRAAKGDSSHKEIFGRFPELLLSSVLWSADERLKKLAGELGAEYGKAWLAPMFAADLLEKPAAEVYEAYQDKIPGDGVLFKEDRKRTRKAMLSVFGRINYMEDTKKYEIFQRLEEFGESGQARYFRRPLKEDLDGRWFERLTDEKIFGNDTVEGLDENARRQRLTHDQLLVKLLCPDNREELARYFYKRALTVKDNRPLYEILARCGWKDFKGLVARFVKNNPDYGVSYWYIRRNLEGFPLTEEERMEEFREIDAFICRYPKSSPTRKNWDLHESQRRMIDEAAGLPGGK